MEERKQFLGRGWAWPPHLDPVTGQVAMSAYEDDIRQAIRIIIETGPGERAMRPDFGCGIHELVFETVDSATLQRVRTVVQDALVRYEARIDVMSVEASTDESVARQLRAEMTEERRRLADHHRGRTVLSRLLP